MRSRYAGPAAALVVPLLLLAVLDTTVGLGTVAWIVGIACALILAAAVWWLRRDRRTTRDREPAEDSGASERGVLRTGSAVAVTVVALVLVWAGLVAPDQTTVFHAGAFERLPLELVVVVALAAVLPVAPRRVLAVLAGAVLAILILVKVLDYGFITAFDRPFDPISDSDHVGIGMETLRDGVGISSANLLLVGIVVLVIALLALPVLALLRLTNVAADNRQWALRAAAALARPLGHPANRRHPGRLIERLLARGRGGRQGPLRPGGARDPRPRDPPRPLQDHPGQRSADRAARQERPAAVRRELREGRRVGLVLLPGDRRRARQRHRAAAGRRLLLAHRLPVLVDVRRAQLAGARHHAVRDLDRHPARLRPADQGQAPHPRHRVHARRLAHDRRPARQQARLAGGPRLLPLRQGLRPPQHRLPRPGLRHRPHARPVPPPVAPAEGDRERAPSAGVRRGRPDLQPHAVDAHPPPHPVGPARRRLGLQPRPRRGVHQGQAFGDAARARKAYGLSIQYTMSTIVSYMLRYGDKNLVVVLLGDHQAPQVTPRGASHDVPMSIIAKDPKVTDQIAGWGWTDGLRPSPQAPVMPMAAFRDRFLTAFGSTPKH